MKGLVPVGEDAFHISGDDQPLRESAPEGCVLDPVDDRGAVASIDEEMLVAPQPVWPADLTIHEAMGRFPCLDLRPPPQRDAAPVDTVVDEGARVHRDWPFGEDLKAEPWRGQFFEVSGFGEETEEFAEGNRQKERVVNEKCLHREDPPSARDAIARTSPEKMIL